MSTISKRSTLLATTALTLAAGLASLTLYAGHRADASLAPKAETAVPVSVAVLKDQPVRLWNGFSGRLKAVDFADIRPEVGGRIVEVKFADGQLVKAGDPLFVIDPSSYQAAVAKAEANLAQATTNATFATAELGRAILAGLVDEAEKLAIERAKQLFGCEFANVQPHSGSQANFAVYTSVLQPGDKLLGMNLSHGGHLTHGNPANFSGKLYNFCQYGVREDNGLIDYDELAAVAQREPGPAAIALVEIARQVAARMSIRAAAAALGNERLTDCDLYVTLEPCAMCAGAISFARIRRLYFAASDAKMGAVEHGPVFFAQPTCHHAPEVYGGIRESEAAEMLREFFRARR